MGVTCAAVLALPLAPPAAAAGPASTAGADTPAVMTASSDVSGSTQSLPLRPLAQDRATGATVVGLAPRTVRLFSLLGVVWDDPAASLAGRVQVRTRSAATGIWSDWQDVETHYTDHGADPGTPEAASAGVRGATAPLWVGESDGVEVRVRPGSDESAGEGGTAADGDAASGGEAGAGESLELPSGLQLELIDPGDPVDPVDPVASHPGEAESRTGRVTAGAAAVSAVRAGISAATGIAVVKAGQSRPELLTRQGDELTQEQQTDPHTGPRPGIVIRSKWGADESLRKGGFVYTNTVKAAFVHHTASGNNYTCAEAPSLIRGFYRYHVQSLGWRDIGYNFLVDKCGTIYEGRAGGVAEPVQGAHTLGFNTDTTGIAVIGSYGSENPSSSAVQAVAQLAAWKLGLHGRNPSGTTHLTSGGGNLYAKGKKVLMNVISGHRDGFNTACPGAKLYAKLDTVRSTASRLQGR